MLSFFPSNQQKLVKDRWCDETCWIFSLTLLLQRVGTSTLKNFDVNCREQGYFIAVKKSNRIPGCVPQASSCDLETNPSEGSPPPSESYKHYCQECGFPWNHFFYTVWCNFSA